MSKFWLPTLRRDGSRAIFAEVLFAELRVFRHFPPISALLRLAIAIDDIHRHLYAFTTIWRHLVMLNVSIGGSRKGKKGDPTGKEQASFSTCLHPPVLSMHVTYCYHCEIPHTLYYNDRHAFLFLSLSLSIIKNAPQIKQLDGWHRLWFLEY